jgi:hypothetical protein
MMSASPGAEDSFELMVAITKAQGTIHNPDVDVKARRQADFNFSSLWRKPRRLLRSSTDHIEHVKLDSPMACEKETISKRSNDRNVTDRESFETMGSPHLSELDESRDVIPVIMKREGWNFTREYPEDYDETHSRSLSEKLRKNVSPQMFLTPSPTKSHRTRSNHQGSTLGNTINDQDFDEVFTLIRNNGYKQRLSSHSRKSNSDSREYDAGLVSPHSGLQKDDTPEVMQVVEVRGVEYLTGDVLLSSISDDSGDSQQTPNTPEIFSNKTDKNEPKILHNNIAESSFSARMKFFQAKVAEGSITRNSFQKNRLQHKTLETKISTTADCESQEDAIANSQTNSPPIFERNATVGATVHRQKENLESTTNKIVHNQSGAVATAASPKNDRKTSTSIPAASLATPSSPLYIEEGSSTVSIQENAKRFGVVLGQRRGSKVRRTKNSMSRGRPVSPTRQEEKFCRANHVEKIIHKADLLGGLGQLSNNCRSQIAPTIPALSPRKQSKSMSVLERRKVFEAKKACSSQRDETPRPFQQTTVSCLSTISSSIVYKCEKCGSAIKTPQIKSGFTKHDLENEQVRKSSDEDESDTDSEDSEDVSTVVRDRRSTLKSAPSEEEAVHSIRSLNVSSDHALSGLSELREETERYLPFMQRLRTFERDTVDTARSLPQKSVHSMVERRALHQKPMVMEIKGIESQWSSDHPSFVAINDDFLLKDDTSDFYSASENSRQVVCQPTDYTPYYAKQHQTFEERHYKDTPTKSSSQNGLTIGRRDRQLQDNRDAWADQRRPQATSSTSVVHSKGEHSGENVSKTQLSSNSENESTKENSIFVSVAFQNDWLPRAGRVPDDRDIHRTRPKNVSSSISDRLAVFQRPCNSVKKWKTSPVKATSRRSSERWSSSARTRSFRNSSLSLQDVIDSRQQTVERRKSSVSIKMEGSLYTDAHVEMNENVRPSELLKMRTKLVESAPPSPLIHRRGFTTSVGRESSSHANTTLNLRCF